MSDEKNRENDKKIEEQKQSLAGGGLAVGMGVGIAIGVALGVALDNIGLGIALGVAIGAASGTAMSGFGAKKEDDKKGE